VNIYTTDVYIALSVYELTKNTGHFSKTLLLVHARGAMRPNLGIKCTLRAIFLTGTILASLSPLMNDREIQYIP
jgi:hypothetical protein